MPRPEYEPLNYLTKRGRKIFYNIVDHCRNYGLEWIDIMELSMLANSYDLYERASAEVNKEGGGYEGEFVPGARGPMSVHYTVMKTEYVNILKHSPKFGLTPGDRLKMFKGIRKEKKADPNEGLD